MSLAKKDRIAEIGRYVKYDIGNTSPVVMSAMKTETKIGNVGRQKNRVRVAMAAPRREPV